MKLLHLDPPRSFPTSLRSSSCNSSTHAICALRLHNVGVNECLRLSTKRTLSVSKERNLTRPRWSRRSVSTLDQVHGSIRGHGESSWFRRRRKAKANTKDHRAGLGPPSGGQRASHFVGLFLLCTFVFVVAARQRAAWKELVSRRGGNSDLGGG